MLPSLTRRQTLSIAAALSGSVLAPSLLRAADTVDPQFAAALMALEGQLKARLGVYVLASATGQGFGYRADERFPLCSTSKALSVGLVLAGADSGKLSLEQAVEIRPSDLVPYSPVTEKHVGGAMSLVDLCEAAITVSDNTAANLLLSAIGGPQQVTDFLRSTGDRMTRLDRNEPALNQATPGDPRDTTTPQAIAHTLGSLALGNALSDPSRELLAGWLLQCTTGKEKLRAGFPDTVRIGDKTGAGGHGTSNDIAVVWPFDGQPFVVSVYLTECAADEATKNAAIARVASLTAKVLNL
ncbi:class A beta-lactamase [Rhizobium halophytocola]|uniref:Beta-lactamase n=1 Tax=Rhizobium halophytocola TaxID=735519 RepID=A0ABS4E1H4_9HYPH|nr:class A beta-lactamase [Rhizobium halophytocola]MBP1851781.1 beta-lactamase class A [Rhizobium halophytocola]